MSKTQRYISVVRVDPKLRSSMKKKLATHQLPSWTPIFSCCPRFFRCYCCLFAKSENNPLCAAGSFDINCEKSCWINSVSSVVSFTSEITMCVNTTKKDYGYAWVVCFLACLCNTVIWGIIWTIGIWITHFELAFGESKTYTSLIGSGLNATTYIAGKLRRLYLIGIGDTIFWLAPYWSCTYF